MSRKSFDKQNDKIFTKLLDRFAKKVETKMVITFQDVAREVLDYIKRPDTTPYWTGNLQDSTGLAIYKDSKLVKYFPPEREAESPQDYEGREIWGYVEIALAFAEGVMMFPSGMWVVLFSAVPYAIDQELLNGYFTVMTSEMEHIFKQRMKQAFGISL